MNTEKFSSRLPECDVLMQTDNFISGGMENVILELGAFLREKGLAVGVWITGNAGDDAEKLLAAGIIVCVHAYDDDWLRKELEESPPKVVLAHYSFLGPRIYREKCVPFIQVLHNLYAWLTEEETARFMSGMEATTLFVSVSQKVKEFSDRRFGIPAEKNIVIPNGIDLAPYLAQEREHTRKRMREQHGIGGNDFVFLAMGSINRGKRTLDIVRCFDVTRLICKNARLVLAGYPLDREYLAEIERYVAENSLQDYVFYVGNAVEPATYYFMADAFVHAAFIEGGPLVLLEALAANLPVVTTDVGFAGQFKGLPGIAVIGNDYDERSGDDFLTYVNSQRFFPLMDKFVMAMTRTCRKREKPDLPLEIVEKFDFRETFEAYFSLIRAVIASTPFSFHRKIWTDFLREMRREAQTENFAYNTEEAILCKMTGIARNTAQEYITVQSYNARLTDSLLKSYFQKEESRKTAEEVERRITSLSGVLEKHLATLKDSSATLLSKISEIEARENPAFLYKKIEDLDYELGMLYRSKSWRMTAPLRIGMGAARKTGRYYRINGLKALVKKLAEKGKGLAERAVHIHKHLKSVARVQNILDNDRCIVLPDIFFYEMPMFQRPQHVARELGSLGLKYIFTEPASGNTECRMVAPNVWTIAAKIGETSSFIQPALKLGKNSILHLYATEHGDRTELIRHARNAGATIFYEYVDEIHPELSGKKTPEHVLRRHQAMLRDPDVKVVATATNLYEECIAARGSARNIALVPNGTEWEHFAKAARGEVPKKMRALVEQNRPIVGYWGALASWFDYELLLATARLRPQYNFVLIGINYDKSMEKHPLGEAENIHYLGIVNYRELPKYGAYFDAGIIPFVINEITLSTSPIKLFEYMSLGLESVTTDMPECRKYPYVHITRCADEFAALLDGTIGRGNDPELKKAIREFVKDEHSWTSRARRILRLLEG